MIWQNPLAWFGLIALAAPLIIHLLGRGRTRVVPFPSLRFVPTTRLMPIKRTRLRDPLLLLLRLLILAAAVAALAQPLILTVKRRGSIDAPIARAIIIDTSASMHRIAAGKQLSEMARDMADSLARSATHSIVIQAISPGFVVPGAVRWLEYFTGRSEIVVISDFQHGSVSSKDLRWVPTETGIQLDRVSGTTTPIDTVGLAWVGQAVLSRRFVPIPDGVSARWSVEPPQEPYTAAMSRSVVGQKNWILAQRGVQSIPSPLPITQGASINFISPGDSDEMHVRLNVTAPAQPWPADITARLASDSLLLAIAHESSADSVITGPGVVFLRDSANHPLAVAEAQYHSLGGMLNIIESNGLGSELSVGLLAAIRRSLSLAPPPSELTSEVLSDSALASMRRTTPTHGVLRSDSNEGDRISDGRWLWLVALLLLAAEWWLRNTSILNAIRDSAVT